MYTYQQRAKFCHNSTAVELFQIMESKQTNLSVSLDLVSKSQLLQLADMLGPEICVLKTHIDILEDFDKSTTLELVKLATKHNFLIFEDRKFADIGNTVALQYEKGIYEIAKWAKITNAHTVSGPSIIDGLKQVGLPRGNGLLLLAEMSSQGTLAKDSYTQATVKMALSHKDFVIGFIAQKKLLEDPSFIYLTPGVQINHEKDHLGQCYITPWQAIYEHETDIIIVGRGIYHHQDPLKAAKLYREQGWHAYSQRIKEKS